MHGRCGDQQGFKGTAGTARQGAAGCAGGIFYDSTILENHVPSITSLAFDAKELGKVACRTLLDLVEGLEVKQKTLLPYEVVLKESTK